MGAFASLEQNAVVVQAAGGSAVATVTGRGIDTAGYSEALVILTLGNVTATGTLAVKLQDAAADTGYTDVTGAAFTAKAGAVDNNVYQARIKLDGNLVKRWIKFIGVVSTDTVDFTVTVILSGGQYNPIALTTTGYAPVAEWTK